MIMNTQDYPERTLFLESCVSTIMEQTISDWRCCMKEELNEERLLKRVRETAEQAMRDAMERVVGAATMAATARRQDALSEVIAAKIEGEKARRLEKRAEWLGSAVWHRERAFKARRKGQTRLYDAHIEAARACDRVAEEYDRESR